MEARIQIDDQEGVLALPTANLSDVEGHRADLVAPPIASKNVMEAIPDLPWGYVGDSEEGHFAAERCYVRIVLSCPRAEHEEKARRVAYLIRFWFNGVRDWIEILTGQDLYEHERPYTERDNRPYGSFFFFDEGQATNVTHKDGIWMSPWPLEESLSAEKWRFSLNAASSGQRPPAEYLIMRDANAAMMRGHYRKAVVDAGSAVELALTRRITERLAARNDAKVIEELLRAHSNLGRRLGLAKRIGLNLPDGVQEDLVDPRNKTVHRGDSPNSITTMTAIHIASEIVGKKETAER